MTSHELADDLTVLYTRAHLLREKVISAGVAEINVDVRSAMDDVIARLDMLNKVLAVDILKRHRKDCV